MAILCTWNYRGCWSRLVIAISLLFFICWTCHRVASAALAFVVLLLSSSAPFTLTKIKAFVKDEAFAGAPIPGKCDNYSALEDPSMAYLQSSSGGEGQEEEEEEEETTLTISRSSSRRSSESSEDYSISDDENLIEISLPDGHFVGKAKEAMELSWEVNDEEENLIEIDIVMGSIKCSESWD